MAIATATALPQTQVVAADIDSKALAVAQGNVASHNVSARVSLLQSDVFSAVSGRFDLIISNGKAARNVKASLRDSFGHGM